MVFDGGVIENVVLSNLTVECVPFEWFWWGDGDPLHFNLIQRSEIDANIDKSKEPPVGVIRNVIIQNVIARGEGPCKLHGHVNSPLENITLENVLLTVADDPKAPLKKGGNALTLENARNFRMKDVEIAWEGTPSDLWGSALLVQNAQGLILDGVAARQASNGTQAPAVVLKNVNGARLLNCQAKEGTGTFLEVSGAGTRSIALGDNNTRRARTFVHVADDVPQGEAK